MSASSPRSRRKRHGADVSRGHRGAAYRRDAIASNAAATASMISPSRRPMRRSPGHDLDDVRGLDRDRCMRAKSARRSPRAFCRRLSRRMRQSASKRAYSHAGVRTSVNSARCIGGTHERPQRRAQISVFAVRRGKLTFSHAPCVFCRLNDRPPSDAQTAFVTRGKRIAGKKTRGQREDRRRTSRANTRRESRSFRAFPALAAIAAQVCPNRIMEWTYPWSRHLFSSTSSARA